MVQLSPPLQRRRARKKTVPAYFPSSSKSKIYFRPSLSFTSRHSPFYFYPLPLSSPSPSLTAATLSPHKWSNQTPRVAAVAAVVVVVPSSHNSRPPRPLSAQPPTSRFPPRSAGAPPYAPSSSTSITLMPIKMRIPNSHHLFPSPTRRPLTTWAPLTARDSRTPAPPPTTLPPNQPTPSPPIPTTRTGASLQPTGARASLRRSA